MVSNVFLIPGTDVIVVLLAECGLCCVTLRHRKAGRNDLKCGAAALGRNDIKAMCGIPIILHIPYK